MTRFYSTLISLFTILLFSACDKNATIINLDGNDNNDSTFKFFKPDSTYQQGTLLNQIEVYDEAENMKVHFVGHFDEQGLPKNVKDIILEDLNAKQDVHILYDEQKLPAFAYVVDRSNDTRQKELFEFEMENDSCFSLNIYEMNWEEGSANLVKATSICKGIVGFQTSVGLELEPKAEFAGKIERLERIINFNGKTLPNSQSNYVQLVEEYTSPSLIIDGLTWLNELEEEGIDSVLTSRYIPPIVFAVGGVVGAVAILRYFFPDLVKEAFDAPNAFRTLKNVLSEFKNTVPDAIPTAHAALLNPYKIMGQLWNGEWLHSYKHYYCAGGGSSTMVPVNQVFPTVPFRGAGKYEISIDENNGTINVFENGEEKFEGGILKMTKGGRLIYKEIVIDGIRLRGITTPIKRTATGSYLLRFSVNNFSSTQISCESGAFARFEVEWTKL